jgi:hypothetical protein
LVAFPQPVEAEPVNVSIPAGERYCVPVCWGSTVDQ